MMLGAELPDTPMQIQMLLIYDPSTAPRGSEDRLRGLLTTMGASA